MILPYKTPLPRPGLAHRRGTVARTFVPAQDRVRALGRNLASGASTGPQETRLRYDAYVLTLDLLFLMGRLNFKTAC